MSRSVKRYKDINIYNCNQQCLSMFINVLMLKCYDVIMFFNFYNCNQPDKLILGGFTSKCRLLVPEERVKTSGSSFCTLKILLLFITNTNIQRHKTSDMCFQHLQSARSSSYFFVKISFHQQYNTNTKYKKTAQKVMFQFWKF